MALRYKIDDIEINVETREIWCLDARVAIEPQVFDLLLFLLENRHRMVCKDELVETIWGGRAISDGALSSCVKAARRALGDDGQRQCMIRTVHGRGFRFVGLVETPVENPVEAPVENPVEAPVETPVKESLGLVPDNGPRLISGIQLGPAGDPATHRDPCHENHDACGCHDHGPQSVEGDRAPTLSSRPSLALLPFQVQGASNGLGIAEGLHRDMTVQFARTRWLFVSARASVMALAAKGLEGSEIGSRLGVRYQLDGALFVADDRLRITLTLTDAERCCEIWAERFERKITDIFDLQDQIVEQVVAAVESEIECQERRRALARHPASLDSWGAYHRALSHLLRFRAEDQAQAEDFLYLAARLDPDSPRVFAALSFLHWQRAFLGLGCGWSEEVARTFDYAHHSVALDPLDPFCHWALGRAHYLEGDIEAGVAELSHAVALSPSFANGQYSLAYGLMFGNDTARGLPAVDQAWRLSPYDPMRFAFSAVRAILMSFQGELDAAADWADRAVREPSAHHHITAVAAWANELAGRRGRALGHVDSLKAAVPDYTREDFFRCFPIPMPNRQPIEGALTRLGI